MERHVLEGAQHGFGVGGGTPAEGWMEKGHGLPGKAHEAPWGASVNAKMNAKEIKL